MFENKVTSVFYFNSSKYFVSIFSLLLVCSEKKISCCFLPCASFWSLIQIFTRQISTYCIHFIYSGSRINKHKFTDTPKHWHPGNHLQLSQSQTQLLKIITFKYILYIFNFISYSALIWSRGHNSLKRHWRKHFFYKTSFRL